ncbi:MAG: heavy metal transporter [Nostocaceae cyanobacterium]|nr:heavy metal transporter [Nostocaceae cyanobacterium]
MTKVETKINTCQTIAPKTEETNQYQDFEHNNSEKLTHASITSPCPHCGKPDWCYSLGELTACKRDAQPAAGWEQKISFPDTDKDGTAYYVPIITKKEFRPKNRTEFVYSDRDCQPCVKVTRDDDGNGKKRFYQASWNGKKWVKGLSDEARSSVAIYRYLEVREAIAAGKKIIWVEGEGVADLLWSMGIPATTTLGGAKGYRKYGDYSQDLEGADLVLSPDRDKPGIAYMASVASDYPASLWLYAPPGNFFWENLPDSGGLDLRDWIESGTTIQQIMESISDRVKKWEELLLAITSASKSPDGVPAHKNPDVTFLQKAFNFLYGSTPLICAEGRLYRWVGNHYKYTPDSIELPRITKYCNTFSKEKKVGKDTFITYPHALPGRVRQVLDWVKLSTMIDPQLLNPPGVNCINGIVRIEWLKGFPVRRLDPHTPDDYFIYEPLIKYDPDADPTDCDRLLLCLDPAQQQVLLRNISASLDIENVRRLKGREIRAILAAGLGSNGKDSLREVVSTIFGHKGITSLTLGDFADYDNGRKFSLAALKFSLLNWSSENPKTTQIDQIQCLKAFVTGNTLYSERKGVDPEPFNPKAIAIFNINETPSMLGAIQAALDRLAVVRFDKTFKNNPDPNNPNELQADPRFAYDPNFIKTCVAPAFLNKMLDALSALIEEGIDYSCTTEAFASVQKENNHLFQFAEDVGLSYEPESEMTAKTLWALLEDWYRATGTLEIDEDSRRTWHDQARPSDRNIKAINQVIPRILKIFPKATVARQYCPVRKNAIQVIKGIGLIDTRANTRTNPAPVAAPITTENQDERATRTNFSTMDTEYFEEKEEKEILEILSPVLEPVKDWSGVTGAGGTEASPINSFDHGSGTGIATETGAGITKEPVESPVIVNESEWMSEECLSAIANDLAHVDSPEELAELESIYYGPAVKAAVELLPIENRQQLIQWQALVSSLAIVTESNSDSTVQVEAPSSIQDLVIVKEIEIHPNLPIVGSWVEIKNSYVRVTQHDGTERVMVDGIEAGNYILGSYPVSECRLLTKNEIISLGLGMK